MARKLLDSFLYLVHLNVGGRRFTTLRATLLQQGDTDSFFSCLLGSDLPCDTDEQGAIFIDRDPQLGEWAGLSEVRIRTGPDTNERIDLDKLQVASLTSEGVRHIMNDTTFTALSGVPPEAVVWYMKTYLHYTVHIE
eukprot:gene22156-33850_t